MDETTGVANHGFIEFHMRENLAGFVEYHVPFGIMCVQVEHFDHLRAAYGRQATDSILRVVAETLRNGLRPSDVVGHWGENQFLAVLPNCGGRGAEKAAERVQKLVAGAGIHWWGEHLSIATSIGYAGAEAGDTGEIAGRTGTEFAETGIGESDRGGGGGSARRPAKLREIDFYVRHHWDCGGVRGRGRRLSDGTRQTDGAAAAG